MRKINITYHMCNGDEVAETCVTFPMEKPIAEDILSMGELSKHVNSPGVVWKALNALAKMQGYRFSRFMCAKEETE